MSDPDLWSPPTFVGDRVIMLMPSDDDPMPIQAGAEGTVVDIDGAGTVHVRWDNGRSLGMIPEKDIWGLPEIAPNTPRCDECGIIDEVAGWGWCGVCGRCIDHCDGPDEACLNYKEEVSEDDPPYPVRNDLASAS